MPKAARTIAIVVALCAVLMAAPFAIAGWLDGGGGGAGFWGEVHAWLARLLRPLWPLGVGALAVGLIFWARRLPLLHLKGEMIFRTDGPRIPVAIRTIKQENNVEATQHLRILGMRLVAHANDDLGMLVAEGFDRDGVPIAVVNRTKRTFALNHEWLDGLVPPVRWPRNLCVAAVLVLTLPGSWFGAVAGAAAAWAILDGLTVAIRFLIARPSRTQFFWAVVHGMRNQPGAPLVQ